MWTLTDELLKRYQTANAALKLEDIKEEGKFRHKVQNGKSVMRVTSDQILHAHIQINTKEHQTNWTLN
jgi:hypothetical protein